MTNTWFLDEVFRHHVEIGNRRNNCLEDSLIEVAFFEVKSYEWRILMSSSLNLSRFDWLSSSGKLKQFDNSSVVFATVKFFVKNSF